MDSISKDRVSKDPLGLKKFLSFSLFVHALFLGLIVYVVYDEIVKPAGHGEYSFVAVSLVGGSTPSIAKQFPTLNGEMIEGSPAPLATTNAEGGENGTSEILREIRGKIERAKFYPLAAKRQKMEGSPVVEFQINKDGSVQNVELKQTSGSPLLDDAARQTIKQAQPFPFYPEPVALSIHYALGGKPQ